MAEYKTEQIRNIAVIGHNGTGKSTLFDAVLFASGKIDKMGSLAAGTLSSDFDEDEKKKKISIKSAMGFAESDGVKINILDAPGTADFIGESRAALQAAECALLVIDSVDGVQIETEKSWRYLRDNNIPRIIFINKMDKERADYAKVIENIKQSLGVDPVLLTIPYGAGADLKGVIDIVNMKLVTPKDGGKNSDSAEIPAELKELAQKEHSKLVELAAEGEDELIEKFLEGNELTDEEIRRSLKKQIENAKVTVVLCGASEKVTGIKSLIQMIAAFAPPPQTGKEYEGRDGKKLLSKPDGPAVAVVWKTYIDQYAGRFNYLKVISGELTPDKDLQNVNKKSKERIGKLYAMTGSKQNEVAKLCAGDMGVVVKLERTSTCDVLADSGNDIELSVINLPNPVFSFAVDAVNKGDVDKIGQFFHKVTDENPTITYEYNGETKETVLSGMGELQLGIVLENLKERAKLEVKTREPRVAYRETITKKVESQYRHKKQSGGHGQFGEVFIKLEPRNRGEGFQFSESIFGGSVPKQYIPGVEKGIVEALQEGVLGKFPVVDVAVDLFDGKYHDVDSSEMAFKIAARQAFKQGMEQAGPQLLEPVMKVNIYVDKEMMGDILSDITSRRGRVLGSGVDESGGSVSVVKATVPLSEMIRYSIDLRSMTQGKASFDMSFSHYDPISGREADNILAARKKQLDDEASS
ncbi:MAG: elongation factor G [Leptospirales bacterium]|nr:elongation factor G [Leptospirales bacterium]